MSNNSLEADDAGNMTGNQDVVMDFIAAMNAKDIDRIMTFFAAEAVYHNMPMDPIRDHNTIRTVIESYLNPASKVEWVMINIAETLDGEVLTERLDRYFINDNWKELPTMGVFSIREGSIVAWRDYFDMQQYLEMMQ